MQRHGQPPPEFIAPMLLRAGALPQDERWALEVKFDGCRAQVRAHAGTFTLRTRPGRLCTDESWSVLLSDVRRAAQSARSRSFVRDARAGAGGPHSHDGLRAELAGTPSRAPARPPRRWGKASGWGSL